MSAVLAKDVSMMLMNMMRSACTFTFTCIEGVGDL